MKNVKVILISVALCATVFANQRIAALGNDAGFWSGDRANVGIFPATINDHAFVEIDGVGDAGGVDATILWGDATKWGFNFDGDDAHTWFNIMWGSNGMGLNVAYIADDNGGEDDPSGFHVAYGKNFDWGELGVGFKSGVAGDMGWNNDASCYWANWRSSMDAWVFDTAKASFQMDDDGGDNSKMTLGFDMFTHLDAGAADILFSLGVDYVSVDAGGTKATWMSLPSASVAVESALNDWATLRGFVNHTYQFSCSDDGVGLCADDSAGPMADNATSYGFGLGFDWGQVALDMNVGETLFTDPMSTITGYGDGNLANGEVTLSYTF